MTKEDSPKFLRLDDVQKITQLGKSTILAWEAQGRFPAAIRLSATFRVWLEADVHNWMMEKHKESTQPQTKEFSNE